MVEDFIKEATKEESLSEKIAEWTDAIQRKRFTLEAEDVSSAVRRLKEEIDFKFDKRVKIITNIKRMIDEIFGDKLT